MRVRLVVLSLVVVALACATDRRPPETVDAGCFGARVLSFQDLTAEVVIPRGEACDQGSFSVVFTRGADTLATLRETRNGTVGFIGTADVNADGRGEFFVATRSTDTAHRGALFAYTDSARTVVRLRLTPLDSAQLSGYSGADRFGFGGADQLVRAFPRANGDTAWFGYSHGRSRWNAIARPAWLR
jgi:hypothetical protein